MNAEDAALLRSLGFAPEKCRETGHAELGRHAVYDAGTCIVRIYGANEGISTEARVEAEKRFSRLAAERGVPAPQVLQSGTFAGQRYIVRERLAGDVMPRDAQPDVWRGVGRMLGRLHAPRLEPGAAFRAQWLDNLRTWERAALSHPVSEGDARRIARARSRLEARATAELFPLTPTGLCHGDFFARNVLVQAGEVSGLIDFELAFEGNVELELARLYRAELAGQPARVEAFFAGYQETACLAPGFAQRLPLLVAGEWLFACSWAFDKVPEYFREAADALGRFAFER